MPTGSDAPLSRTLPGTWWLESRIDRTADGDRRVDPSLGADPVAILVYDRGGHFAAQFMKRDRTTAGQGAPTATGGANNSRAVGGYDAYFGRYSVDDTECTVTQTLEGALSAENVGMTLTRHMTVDGDRLVIELATTGAEGEPLTRTLTWTRVA